MTRTACVHLIATDAKLHRATVSHTFGFGFVAGAIACNPAITVLGVPAVASRVKHRNKLCQECVLAPVLEVA